MHSLFENLHELLTSRSDCRRSLRLGKLALVVGRLGFCKRLLDSDAELLLEFDWDPILMAKQIWSASIYIDI
jgi:hypothetical protein